MSRTRHLSAATTPLMYNKCPENTLFVKLLNLRDGGKSSVRLPSRSSRSEREAAYELQPPWRPCTSSKQAVAYCAAAVSGDDERETHSPNSQLAQLNSVHYDCINKFLYATNPSISTSLLQQNGRDPRLTASIYTCMGRMLHALKELGIPI